MATSTLYIPRLKAHYNAVVKADLVKEIGVKNVMQVPTLEKIVINMGVGEAVGPADSDCRIEIIKGDSALVGGIGKNRGRTDESHRQVLQHEAEEDVIRIRRRRRRVDAVNHPIRLFAQRVGNGLGAA